MRPFFFIFLFLFSLYSYAQNKRARDLGIKIGVLSTGKWNAITDVPGVKAGHTTLIKVIRYEPVLLQFYPMMEIFFNKKFLQAFMLAMDSAN